MSQDLYATFAAAGVALAGAVVAASFLVEEAPKVPHACGARELDATHMIAVARPSLSQHVFANACLCQC